MSLADRLSLAFLAFLAVGGLTWYLSALHEGDVHTQAVFACVGNRAPTREVLAECTAPSK